MVTTHFYLDIRYSKPGCPSPLKIVFTLRRARDFMPIGIKLMPEQWNATLQQVINHPRKNQLNTMLLERKVDVDRMLYAMTIAGELTNLKVSEIRKLVQQRLTPAPPPEPKKLLFIERFDSFVSPKSEGTKRIYETTRARLNAYLGEEKLAKLAFVDMDVAWLKAFDAWLARTSPSRNARNIHFRNIRAVFNDALDDEAISCYPFRKFKIIHEPTRKRALTREQFRALMELELKPCEERYRDCFKLSFALQGINIVDLCRLTDIVNDRVEYKRAKTHRLYSVILSDEAKQLIEKYRGKNQLLNYLDSNKDYRSFYKHLGDALRSMGKRIGVTGLSTYWARHSWATFAASLDIPKETIAAALGHGGNTVTDIYIDFDQRKADEANLRVIDLAKKLGF